MVSKNLVEEIKKNPYWQVRIYPQVYKKVIFSGLKECLSIIEKNKVSLRGWDYPHLSNSSFEPRSNYVSAWNDSLVPYEYWEFYLSGQFRHIFNVNEYVNEYYGNQLRGKLASSYTGSSCQEILEKIGGFLAVTNIIYQLSEIFEFARRLSCTSYYETSIVINITLNLLGVEFALSDPYRALYGIYRNRGSELSETWILEKNALPDDGTNLTLKAITWLLNQFNWLEVPEDVIKEEQKKFLARRPS